MAVGITYTGVNGQTTAFTASSPSGALERLARIPGYCGNEADAIAAGLAKGWRARHKERAARYAPKAQPFVGSVGGRKYTGQNGLVSELPRITGVKVEDGQLKVTSRKDFVSDGGSVIGVGGESTRRIDLPESNVDNDISIVSGPDSNLKIVRNGNTFTVDVYYV